MRLLLFVIVELLLLPISILGSLAYLVKLKAVNQPKGISGTAYKPFFLRAMTYGIGACADETSYRLASVLPALSPLIWTLIMWPTAFASRVSGYKPVMLAGPVSYPTTLMMTWTMRAEFFDEILLNALERVQQVVILGAGWDSRAYEQLRHWHHPIFEVDAPPTQRAKIEALDKAGIDHSHVTFVESNFNQTPWFYALTQNGFDPAIPTCVLWEGVTMYLPEDMVRNTLEQVAELAPGSMIAFDYLAQELIAGEGLFKFVIPWLNLGFGLIFSERLVFGLPMQKQAQQVAASFLESMGLTMDRFEMVAENAKLTAVYGFVLGERQ